MPRQRRTDYVILGALTRGPMSGYDIHAFVRDTVSHFWAESFGQIYPALRRLERAGHVAGRREPGQRGPDRRIYSIRPSGRALFRTWLAEPPAPAVPRYEHSLKLFFGRHADPAAIRGLLERLQREHERTLALYRGMEAHLRERLDQDPDARFQLAVLRGGVRYAEMVLAWGREIEVLLRPVLDQPRRTRKKA